LGDVIKLSEKYVVVGAGSIGRRHIGNLNLLGYENIDVVDTNKDSLRYIKNNFKINKVFSNIKDLPRDDYQVGFVLTPPAYHISIALELANKGMDLFIEKPLSHNLNNVDKLLEIKEEKNLVMMTGFNMRFNLNLIKIKKLLDEGRIGKIISARVHFGSYLPLRHPNRDYRNGYAGKRSLGGGVILDNIHQIEYIQWFLGDVKEIFCYYDKKSGLEIDTEDFAEILMKFKNGEIASLHLDYIQRPYQNACELIGETGTIRWRLSLNYDVENNNYSFESDTLKVYDINTSQWQIFKGIDSLNEPYIRETEYFLNCVKLRKKPMIDVEYGLKILKVALAAKESSKKNKVIEVKK
jgi:predicted dehydrogenase